MKDIIKNIITFIVIATFSWSNLVWAGGMDTLAPESSFPGLYLTMQVDMLTREALQVLNKQQVRNNHSLYEKRKRIEDDIAGLVKDSRGKIKFLVFPDMNNPGGCVYYVFNMDSDYFIRISTDRDVKDRFQGVLDDIEMPVSGGIGEIKFNGDRYYREVFIITPEIEPLIRSCLEKIYPPEIEILEVEPQTFPPQTYKPDPRKFLSEPANVCNQDIWERYKLAYSRYIGDSFNELRKIDRRVKVSIVVPMYKEEVRLRPKSPDNPAGEDAFRRKVLQLEACRLINPLLEWELIFVDNGTQDGASGKLVEKLWGEVQVECRKNGIELDPSQVKVLYITPQEAKEMGSIKGGAVYKGMQYALSESNPDIIFYTDTDISTDLRQIGLLLEPILFGGNDVAIGSRWLPGSLRDKKTIIDILASRLYNLIVRIFLPLGDIKDTQCGFKAFKRELLEWILPYASDNGFSFDTELLSLSKKIGSRIEEVPIAWFGSPIETKVDLMRDAYRMILALWRQRHSFYRTRIEVRLEPENINVRSFIKYLCHKETAINIPVEERLDLLSKSLSALLKRADAEEIAEELRISLIAEKGEILPEARMMIESYLSVYEIKAPVTIAVCIAIWKGQEDFLDEPNGKGWLAKKTKQFFEELLSVNPKLKGFIVFVNDGDDSKDGKKTSDVIRELLSGERYDDVKDKIYVLELSQEDKSRIGSIKHGALALGMRFSVDRGADLIMYTDSDLSTHLGLSGLLLDSIINKGNDVAFGSIRKKGAVVPYRAFWRNLGTVVYNWWVRLILVSIRGIKDTQRSFKMFRREVLEKILPVEIKNIEGDGNLGIKFNPDFIYDFTGDTEWLGRARTLGYKLDEIPTTWIDSSETSTVDFWEQVMPMFISAWRQRKTQEIFRRTRLRTKKSANKLENSVFPKDLHRGKIDEIKETHPALEKAANSGRMFALEITHLEHIDDLKDFSNEDLAGLFTSYLINLRSFDKTKTEILKSLENQKFKENLIKGFQLMYEAIKGESLLKDKPIRLCIVVEDKGLPTIVFKDPFNNLLAHSGKGEKTGTQIISIYAGYNSVEVAIERRLQEDFMELIKQEIRDIQRGYHKDDYPSSLRDFYNKVLVSKRPLLEICREPSYDYLTGFFWNTSHYKWLKEIALPRVSQDKRKHFKIAVLGCSTGQEPISLAIWFLENGYSDFEIVSIDDDSGVLGRFEKGIYTQKEMQSFIENGCNVFNLSEEKTKGIRDKYFDYDSENLTYILRDCLRDRLKEKILTDITIPGNIQKGVGKADILFYSNIAYRYEEPAHSIIAEEISNVSGWVFVTTKKSPAIKVLNDKYGLPIKREDFFLLYWKVFSALPKEWLERRKDLFVEFCDPSVEILFNELKGYSEEDIRYGIEAFCEMFREKQKEFVEMFQQEVANIIKNVIADISNAKEDLIKRYGPGLLSGIKDIEIVGKDEPLLRDGIARIRMERLRHKLLIEERLLYEAVHEILGLIIPDKPELAEAVATLYTGRWFSGLSQEEQKELIRLGYRKEGVEIRGIDPTEIKKIENILQEVLILFNELIKATGGGDIEEESIKVIRTFRDIRIEGKDIPKNVRRAIGYIAGRMDKIPDIVPDGIDLSKKHYVLVDKERAKAYKDTMDEISQKWNVQFVTEIPEGVDINDVVALVDLGDLDKWQLVEGLLCLPFPYMKISFALAAELASTGAELKNTKAFRFVKGFYENLFGIALTDEEVLSWFYTPKNIKARLRLIKERDFEILRLGIKKLDSST